MTAFYHPELLARPVPRYTSYPTAAEFHEGVGSPDMEAALDAVPIDAAVSLYLHIPYCESICWYCGCNTGAANRSGRLQAYVEALEAEIALAGARLGGRGRIGRIAFGGGSPNAVAPSAFARLLDRLAGAFALDAPELSVELDPRTLTRDWLRALADAGVGRASLGVQTLEPALQARIGRVQPEATIREAVAGLRAAGISSLNCDLMYGLPGQDEGDIARTLAATLEMAPERIAYFGYAHVPHLIPRQRRIDAANLSDAAARFAQAEAGRSMLEGGGYEAVGFDHFALPGDPLAAAARGGTLRRNFQGFTDDPAEILIGLGASAISALPDRLIQNEKNAGRYRMLVSAGRLPAARGILRSRDDRARGRIVEHLLCRGGADAAGPWQADAAARLRPFADAGLVRWTGSRLDLVPGARPYARAIAAAFDAYRPGEGGRFSNAV